MEQETFLTYQKFNDQAEAAELAEIFQQNGIAFVLEDSSLNFDASFSFNELNKEFRVKIRGADFEKANLLLDQESLKLIADIPNDYYLYQFADDELLDVLIKTDEWSNFDVNLSKHILEGRGVKLTTEQILLLRATHVDKMAKPEKSENGWVIAGYIFAFSGGFLGIFIGWHLAYHKKTLPNGEQNLAYTDGDRTNGKRIFAIGLIMLTLLVAYKFYYALAVL